MSSNEIDDVELSANVKSIKFNIQFNEEQKNAKSLTINNTITLISGGAGSGKTTVAVQTALDQLFKKNFKKIIITRPLVTAGEEIGILPGDIDDKLGPYLRPIFDMMSTVYNGKAKIEKLIAEKTIEIIPFGLMRGLNLDDAFVIADEIQNTTKSQLKLLLTRITKNSKLVLCGDDDQIDLKNIKESGYQLLKHLEGIDGYASIELKANHRHPIVKEILDRLDGI